MCNLISLPSSGLDDVNHRKGSSLTCIFCCSASVSFSAVEHIIPESLGNKSAVLPAGVVCDRCNQYFGTKVEGPVLDSPMFKCLRLEQSIPNKKGRIPTSRAIVLPNILATIRKYVDKTPTLYFEESDQKSFMKLLQSNNNGQLVFPSALEQPAPKLMSRFLAKCALELLTSKAMQGDRTGNSIIFEKQFDPLRMHARFGHYPNWPITDRVIHDMDASYPDEGVWYQVVNEMDLLLIPLQDEGQFEVYFVAFFW